VRFDGLREHAIENRCHGINLRATIGQLETE
jgi:hypothetical protein